MRSFHGRVGARLLFAVRTSTDLMQNRQKKFCRKKMFLTKFVQLVGNDSLSIDQRCMLGIAKAIGNFRTLRKIGYCWPPVLDYRQGCLRRGVVSNAMRR